MSDRAPISNQAIVLRAGVLGDFDAAVASCQDARDDAREGLYGLSVEVFEVETLEEAMRGSKQRNRKCRLSTAKRLRDAGFELHPTFDEPHATLRIPEPMTRDVWAVLLSAFDYPVLRP